MNRLRQSQVEAIAGALEYVPRALHDRLGCDVFCEAPIFAGVHGFESASYGECFAEAFTAWALYTPEQMEHEPYWTGGYSRQNAEWFDRLAAGA